MIRKLVAFALCGIAAARSNSATAQKPPATNGSHLTAVKLHNVSVSSPGTIPMAAVSAARPQKTSTNRKAMKSAFRAAAAGMAKAKAAAREGSGEPAASVQAASTVPAVSVPAVSSVPVESSVPVVDSVPPASNATAESKVLAASVPSEASVPAASANASRAINFLPPGDRFDPPSAAAGKGFEPKGKSQVARGGNESARALAAKPTVQPDHIYNDDFVKDGPQQYSDHQWNNGGSTIPLLGASAGVPATSAVAVLLAAALGA